MHMKHIAAFLGTLSLLSCAVACVDPPAQVISVKDMSGLDASMVTPDMDSGEDVTPDSSSDSSGDMRPLNDMRDMDSPDASALCPDECVVGCNASGECLECVENSDCDNSISGKVCDTTEHICVVCLSSEGVDEGCSTEEPICMENECITCSPSNAENVFDEVKDMCVECLMDTDCDDPNAPLCNAEEGICEPCAEGLDDQGDMACASLGPEGPGSYCGGDQGCVQCLEPAHCITTTGTGLDISTPTCSAASRCIACVPNAPGDEENADCAAASGGDQPHCNADSTCVACLNNLHCVGKGTGGEDLVCDLTTNACVQTAEVGSRDVGQSCVYDDECELNSKCVQMTYGTGMPDELGGYCMWERTGSNATCPQKPWGFTLSLRGSQKDSTPRSFCGPNEEKVSPEAVYNTVNGLTSCTLSTECGLGGECIPLQNGVLRCTYACTDSLDCLDSCLTAPDTNIKYCK
jgi:hypothetical protein